MRTGSRRFADTVVLDHGAWSLKVDGIEIPWWVEPDPEIVHLEHGVTALRIGILCEGVAMIIGEDGTREIIDPVLGNVGDWAKDHVLQGLRERLSWLTA